MKNNIIPMSLCLFPSHSQLAEEIFLITITKCMDMRVLLKLTSVATISTPFDLWTSMGGTNTFALIINYLTKTWEPMYVTIGLFELNDTTCLCMACKLFEKFGFIIFIKDVGNILESMAIAWHSIVDCETLNL
jgi:hypothetical protein